MLKKNGEEIGSDGWCRVIDCKKYSELSAEDKKKPSFLGKEDENDNSGASLLLAPATTYSARIFLDEDKSSDPGHGFVDVDLEPGGGAGFVAGDVYKRQHQQYFANRSFIAKQVGNVRDVGFTTAYKQTSGFPFSLEAGLLTVRGLPIRKNGIKH